MRRTGAAVVALAGLSGALSPASEAHKGITSKHTYSADVYPIFAKRCGRCHVDGGVGPMSLLKYEDAFPWAESLRTELLAVSSGEEATPAAEDPDAFVKVAHRQVTARELDVILDWAVGGTPEGDKTQLRETAMLSSAWAAGQPDAVIPMPQPYALAGDVWDTTQEFVMPIAITMPRIADRFDVLPGTPAIVRSVTVSLRAADGTVRPLGTWFPRQHPQPIAIKPGIRADPGSQVIARIRYKKTWKYEGTAMTDLSSVGLYFSD
jgi:hypothetical protein